ncbi:hypothetical protein BX070DRAFT_234469 [Coemansia spiralis]|nr:hypothetical protein BX070DRAFT_234469 [Coemansia spiralis]
MARPNINIDLLYYILKQFVRNHSGSLDKWKAQLPLLAVCRLWRRAVLPMAYSQLYLSCSKGSHKRGMLIVDTPFITYFSPTVISNIQLVAPKDCSNRIKSISINKNSSMDLDTFLEEITYMLENINSGWSHVESLMLDITSSTYIPTANDEINSIYSISTFDKLIKLAEYFANSMPNVTKINSRQKVDFGSRAIILNRIASTLAPQLKSLKSDVFSSIDADSFSSNLTCLELLFLPTAFQEIPYVCAKTLKKLKLTNISHDFTWYSFCNKAGPKNLEFISLEQLHLYFLPGMDVLQNNIRSNEAIGRNFCKNLHFPKLECLSINCSLTSATLLKSATFPEHLRRFKISFCSKWVIKLSDVDFTSAERNMLADSFTESVDRSSNFLTVSNCLFGSNTIARQSEAVVRRELTASNLNSFNWSNLEKLKVTSPLYILSLLTILASYKQLKDIAIEDLVLDCNAERNIEIEMQQALTSQLAPVSTSVRIMRLIFGTNQYGTKNDAIAAKYLLLRMPGIQKIMMPKSQVAQIKKFVAKYHPYYPSLTSVIIGHY